MENSPAAAAPARRPLAGPARPPSRYGRLRIRQLVFRTWAARRALGPHFPVELVEVVQRLLARLCRGPRPLAPALRWLREERSDAAK